MMKSLIPPRQPTTAAQAPQATMTSIGNIPPAPTTLGGAPITGHVDTSQWDLSKVTDASHMYRSSTVYPNTAPPPPPFTLPEEKPALMPEHVWRTLEMISVHTPNRLFTEYVALGQAVLRSSGASQDFAEAILRPEEMDACLRGDTKAYRVVKARMNAHEEEKTRLRATRDAQLANMQSYQNQLSREAAQICNNYHGQSRTFAAVEEPAPDTNPFSAKSIFGALWGK